MKEKDNSKELKSARGALRAEQAPGGLEGDNQSWFAGHRQSQCHSGPGWCLPVFPEAACVPNVAETFVRKIVDGNKSAKNN